MDCVRLSKFLSLILRHRPELIGLELDVNGWAQIDDLLRKMEQNGNKVSREELDHIVATNNKKRFAYDETRNKIRASQGHSIEVDLQLEARKPPETLYHGTSINALESILRDGLVKKGRQHVHLSADKETAFVVGKRHGKPIVFRINCSEMYNVGHVFYLSQNGVWLTDNVPVMYLTRE